MSPLGFIPKPGTLNIDGLSGVDMDTLFAMNKSELEEDTEE